MISIFVLLQVALERLTTKAEPPATKDMKLTELSRKTARAAAGWLRRLVRCHGRTQNENGLDHLAIRSSDVTSQHETTSRVTCDGAWGHDFLHALTLLDMMRCQCLPQLRADILERTPRVRGQLEALESLWQSLGCPRSELWLRLHVYVPSNDNDLCSYKSDTRMTPNEKS